MSAQTDLEGSFSPAVLASGVLSAILGLAVLLGWWSHNSGLVASAPWFGPAASTAALGFLVFGAGLAAAAFGRAWTAIACGVATALLGLAVLAEYIAGVNLGIDELLMTQHGWTKGFPHGRLAPNAALCFALAGTGLALMGARRFRQRHLMLAFFGSLVASLGLAPLLSYPRGITAAFRWSQMNDLALPGAAGFLLAAAGLIGFAWRDGLRGSRPPSRWFALATNVGVLTVTLYFWQALVAQQQVQLRQTTEMTAEHLKADLAAQLESRIAGLERLARHFENPARRSQQEWTSETELAIGAKPAYTAVAWIEAELAVRWTVPAGYNDFRVAPLDQRVLSQWAGANAGAVILERPARDGGAAELLVCAPMYADGSLSGLVAGVLPIQDLVDPLARMNAIRGYSVGVASAGGTLYPPAAGRNQDAERTVEARLDFHSLSWRIRVWPNAGLVRERQSALPAAALIVGFLTAAFFAAAVQIAETSQVRAQEVETTNRRLLSEMSERQRAENALRESEERFRDLFERAPVSYHETDCDGIIRRVNRAECTLLGLEPSLVLGRRVWDFVVPDQRESTRLALTRRISGEPPAAPLHRRFIRADGTQIILEMHENAILGENGTVIGIRSALLDITAREQAEEARKKSESLLSNVLNTLPVGVFVTDRNGQILLENPAANRILAEAKCRGLGFSCPCGARSEETGALLAATHCPLARTLRDGQAVLGETVVTGGGDGSARTVLRSVVPIRSAGQEILGAIEVDQDITGQKRAEERIRRSLAEKEMLLREIHHRVKNNLQVISSLLNLESGHLRTRDAYEMFKESQSRIRSMALVHEKLYQANDLARVDVAEYVRGLASHLFRCYGANSGKIGLQVDTEGICLGIDEAVPCGLIINELLSNSLKHAFPAGQAGEIRVALHRGDGYRLVISDDGVGLPPGVSLDSPATLGLQLVSTLTEQLSGTLELGGGKGTEVRIAFPAGNGVPA